MSAERYECRDPHGRFRYGPWRGGRDPLAPPYDLRAALDKIGEDVLSAGTVRDALRELMQRGLDGRGGLDKLAQRLRKLRAAARKRGDLGGTLDQIRAALDQALAAEREQLAGMDGDEHRLAEMELETIPDDVAGAVRALSDYQWRSDEARQTYQAITQMLQREVLDAQFAGMKQALEGQDPEAMQQVKDMLADLNALLAKHARNEDTTDAFAEFMDKHGEFFPEQPETVEELIDALARRQAAAQRMMNSLSPEQREQLAQLMQQALSDADLASEMAQLSDNLRALRPGLDRSSPTGMGQGGQPLGYGEAVEAVAELADLEALEPAAVPEQPGVDPRRRRRRPAGEAARPRRRGRPAGAARPGARARAAGLSDPHRRRAQADPRALRRLGQTALKRVFAQLEASGHGDHDDRRTGSADERTGLTRPWVFGDELPWTRPGRSPTPCAGPGCPTGGRGGAVQLGRRGLRGDRDRAADDGRRGALRRPVVLDGAGRPVGSDEADRPGAEPPDRDPVPAGLAAGDRVQPVRPAADPAAAGRGRAGLDPGHQPAARADPGRPAPAAAPRRRAGGAGGHRRGADRAPRRGRGGAVPVADHARPPCGRPWPRSTSCPATARRSTRSCWGRIPVWRGSSTPSPGGAVVGCSPPTSAGWGSTWWRTTCAARKGRR